MEENTKKPWLSKTVWISVIVALAPLFPPVAAVVATNPEMISFAVGAVFAAIRLISSQKISL